MSSSESYDVCTADGRANFEPGETVQVVARWELNSAPAQAEVRLVWYTEGTGSLDVSVLKVVPFADPQVRDERQVEIELPESPYSFFGRMITLKWALELILGKNHSTKFDFVMAPGAKAISLKKSIPSK